MARERTDRWFGVPQPAGPPPAETLTKAQLEETMKAMLAPPGSMGGDSDLSALERFTTDVTASARMVREWGDESSYGM